ncbi:hypothetical protein PLESTB_000525500 [Pleodorina starrii]|uniref:Uncharacterized protein n=1 Tax=Pleodorina starrii TaxID=330485 RepID=A0A9W6BH26_9CHLO|nr:hypothetical protein PLESTB_000525500 [Pleodorina starrii]
MKLVASCQDAAALKAEVRETQLTKKVTKVQEACRKKLEVVHNAYTQAKRKYDEAVGEKDQALQDNQELQTKYAQKSMQTRKLQEALKKSQQQVETLQHEKGALQQELLALRQEVKVVRQNGGSSGGGRSISPLAPGGMETTIQQRTTAKFVSTSPPNMGFGNKAIQQSLAPSSGRVQGIIGGYRTQTAGRILGGSLDPNSPGGVLPSSTQGLGRTTSDGSFGAGLGGGPRHGGGAAVVAVAQDPHNNELRRMLGMPLTQPGGRNPGLLGESLFSM